MPEETNISEVNFGKTIPIKFKNKLKFTVTVTLKRCTRSTRKSCTKHVS